MVEGVRRGRIMAVRASAASTSPSRSRSLRVAARRRRRAQGVHGQGARRSSSSTPSSRTTSPSRGSRRRSRSRTPSASPTRSSAHLAVADRREADAARGRVVRTSGCRSSRTCWRSRSRRSTSTAGSTTRSRSRWRRPRRSTTSTRRSRRSTRSSGARTTATDEVEELKKKIETPGHAEGSPREGRAGAEAPRGDAAGLGRGDGLAQLHRVARRRALEEGLARVQGPDPRREDPERGPLRPREGQGADPRVPGGPPARPEDEGLDHLLRRPAGRRQDLARQVDRPLAQPQVRAAVARRRARRGGDPRPPADLHRRLPGPDHPDDEEGRARSTRSSCSTRSTRCPRTSAATRPRRCSRSWTRSRTTPSWTTTSTSSTTSRRSCSSPRPTSPTRSRRP